MTQNEPLDEYVREAYMQAREVDTDAISGRYGAEYDRWLRKVQAEAFEVGAEACWQTTGEGWNAEYPGNDGELTWREVAGDSTLNPYLESE